ncbi:TniB family NTP-binding protein [Curtobacterium flaccumfaciens pv. flaccumfaciens]|uniref:TniB family NTP-binding protein n=1 Tax=Curtobacterium flaccumfaciens TaxID=2035 RepID=UPI0021B0FE42|nr:TniB family NTP-binding protein [Curtobacterium flaccumfaciens]QYI96225.1 TniB family NTP-binding protein [Curtobacterium flaccumfaciens pv. flaccumfaciens]
MRTEHARLNHVNWVRLVRGNPYERPESRTLAALHGLNDEEREAYNDRRADWHANSGVIKTPQLVRAHSQLGEIVAANQHVGDRVRGAAVVDAPPGLGKTTIANSYAFRYWAKEMRRGLPDDTRFDRIPVIKVGLKANVTTKWLTERMCKFMGLPTTGTETALHDRLLDAAVGCETRLIVIDEIQFLNFVGKEGRKIHNHIKFLANELPATFLFVGHSIRATTARSNAAIQDAARDQTDSRWTYVDVDPFQVGTEEGRQAWRSFLLTVESKLVLANLKPGMLADGLADYVYARTLGRMQHITSLIVRGCVRAIDSGEEQLTRDLLDNIKLEKLVDDGKTSRVAGADRGVYDLASRKPRNLPRTTPRKPRATANVAGGMSPATKLTPPARPKPVKKTSPESKRPGSKAR